MMDNNRIFKKIIPFLVIFVLSIAYGLYNGIQQSMAPVNADNSSINVDILNLKSDISLDVWEWNGVVMVSENFKEPFQVKYTVKWCGASSGKEGEANPLPCEEDYADSMFREILAEGSTNIDARDTVFMFDHKSVTCGTVEAVAEVNGEKKDVERIDTGVVCQDGIGGAQGFSEGGSGAFGSGGSQDISADQIINDLLNLITFGGLGSFGGSGGSGSSGGTGDTEGTGGAGGTGDGTAPVLTPGQQNPGGGSQPGGSGSSGQTQAPIPPTNNVQAQHVINLANYFIQNCGGRVNTSYDYKTCVNRLNINSKNDSLAKSKIFGGVMYRTASSPRGSLQMLQCVGFTQAAVAAAMGIDYGNFGHAKQHAYNHAGFTFIRGNNPPAVNDLVIFNWYTYGHIAYVTKVSPRAFEVVEANMPHVIGEVRRNSYTINQPGLEGWLRR